MHGTEDDGEQCLFCLGTAVEHSRNRRCMSSSVSEDGSEVDGMTNDDDGSEDDDDDGSEDDEMTSDDVDDHDDKQTLVCLWESEAFHELSLKCLGTAEINEIRHISNI